MTKINLSIIFVLLFCMTGCLTAYDSVSSGTYSCEGFLKEPKPEAKLLTLKSKNINPNFQYSAKEVENWANGSNYNNSNQTQPIILRYSDGGQLSNRCDYTKALSAIRNTKGSKIVVVYIHGWRNDSGSKQKILYNFYNEEYPEKTLGSNLENFTKFLKTLQEREKQESEINGSQTKKVIGIFISWKGGNGIPVLETLGYLDRRGGADNLSRSGEIPRLLGAIENISKIQEERANSTIDNQLIFMGHSFGGRILYHSIIQNLIATTQSQYPNKSADEKVFGNVGSTADLVLLVNPVIEAASYRAVNEFRHSSKCFGTDQLPLMLAIQSENDWANGYAFRAGQAFGLALRRPQRRTMGFTPHYITHELTATESGCTQNGSNVNLYSGFCKSSIILKANPDTGDTTDIEGDCDNESKPNRTPFMVVKASKDVLDGHGWLGPQFSGFEDWLVEFIETHFSLQPLD